MTIRARNAINPAHACHSADVLTPTERAASRLLDVVSGAIETFQPKPLVKLGDIPEIKEKLMATINTRSDFESQLKFLSAIERAVFDSVPSSEAWGTDLILSDAIRRNSMQMDRAAASKALGELVAMEMIAKFPGDKFKKTSRTTSFVREQMAEKIVTNVTQAEIQPENEIKKNDEMPERLFNLSQRLSEEASQLQEMARRLELAALSLRKDEKHMALLNQLAVLMNSMND